MLPRSLGLLLGFCTLLPAQHASLAVYPPHAGHPPGNELTLSALPVLGTTVTVAVSACRPSLPAALRGPRTTAIYLSPSVFAPGMETQTGSFSWWLIGPGYFPLAFVYPGHCDDAGASARIDLPSSPALAGTKLYLQGQTTFGTTINVPPQQCTAAGGLSVPFLGICAFIGTTRCLELTLGF